MPRARRGGRSMNIVVGTHALLAKGISFKKLGLLIIDEEQHFGVTHKRRLKEMRSGSAVLTLTATPFRAPCNCLSADRGARPVVIATPPVVRLAIHLCFRGFDTIPPSARRSCANGIAAGKASMSFPGSPICPTSRTS